MKTKPNQLRHNLHFYKGALNDAALSRAITQVPSAPHKKRMDYETRSTVEEPTVSEGYKRMANGELRRLDHKPREGNGKKLRRQAIRERQHKENDFYSSVHEQMQLSQVQSL